MATILSALAASYTPAIIAILVGFAGAYSQTDLAAQHPILAWVGGALAFVAGHWLPTPGPLDKKP